MATYADLKARIIREMSRDDLLDDHADTLKEHIADACEHYADVRFWFNQVIATATTVANTATLAVPVALRIVDRIAGPYYDLSPVTLDQIENPGTWASPGALSSYTYIDGQLQFFPLPDAAYALTIYGIKQIDVPTADATSNAWTNEAASLIASHTRFTLWRDVFRNSAAAEMASGAVQQTYGKLRRETDRRLRTRLTAQLTRPNGRSVRMGCLDRL